MGFFDKKIKKMDMLDMGLTKLSSMLAILFVITIWPAAMDWVQSINPWYFFAAFVVIVARPFYRFYLK